MKIKFANLGVKVEGPVVFASEELPAPVAQKLVQTDADFQRRDSELLLQVNVFLVCRWLNNWLEGKLVKQLIK